jgi:hypothetical protein
MTVIMFQPWAEALIVSGRKIHTIRPPRKRPLKPNEELSFRVWTGKPYRSPQREFYRTRHKFTFPVRIGKTVRRTDYDQLLSKKSVARDDGFLNWAEMSEWFEKHHGLPFDGDLIHWEPGRHVADIFSQDPQGHCSVTVTEPSPSS